MDVFICILQRQNSYTAAPPPSSSSIYGSLYNNLPSSNNAQSNSYDPATSASTWINDIPGASSALASHGFSLPPRPPTSSSQGNARYTGGGVSSLPPRPPQNLAWNRNVAGSGQRGGTAGRGSGAPAYRGGSRGGGRGGHGQNHHTFKPY